MKSVPISPSGVSQPQQLPPRSSHLLETLLANLDGMVYRSRGDNVLSMDFVSDGCHALLGYHPQDLMSEQVISYE